MATQKFILDTRRRRKDGTYPVVQRVYVGTKHLARGTGICIHKTEWDAKKQRVNSVNPNHTNLNNWLQECRIEIQNLFLKSGFNPDHLQIKQYLLKTDTSSESTFFVFAAKIIDDMLSMGRHGNAKAYKDAMNRLHRYIGSDNLKFSDITYQFLYDFDKTLLAQGLKVNSVASYMRSIRVLYNLAIKHGIASNQEYPFNMYQIKTKKTVNKVLTVSELKKMYVMLDKGYPGDVYLSAFFLSFCFIGMSMMDLFLSRWEDMQEGRLVYTRRKTGKIYSILVPKIAYRIIRGMKAVGSKSGFILPILNDALSDLEKYNVCRNHVGYCNRRLKQIATEAGLEKSISSYHARYSWANTAKKLGIPKDVVSEALGHEYGNRVTDIYLDKYHSKKIDRANEMVVDAVFGKTAEK